MLELDFGTRGEDFTTGTLRYSWFWSMLFKRWNLISLLGKGDGVWLLDCSGGLVVTTIWSDCWWSLSKATCKLFDSCCFRILIRSEPSLSMLLSRISVTISAFMAEYSILLTSSSLWMFSSSLRRSSWLLLSSAARSLVNSLSMARVRVSMSTLTKVL